MSHTITSLCVCLCSHVLLFIIKFVCMYNICESSGHSVAVCNGGLTWSAKHRQGQEPQRVSCGLAKLEIKGLGEAWPFPSFRKQTLYKVQQISMRQCNTHPPVTHSLARKWRGQQQFKEGAAVAQLEQEGQWFGSTPGQQSCFLEKDNKVAHCV